MKLAFFDDFKLGVVTGDKVVDVSDVVKDIPRMGPQDVIRGVIEQWGTYKGKLADAAAKGRASPSLRSSSARRCRSPRTSSAWR